MDNVIFNRKLKEMEAIETFCNLLWANLPKCFSVSFNKKNNTLKVYITNANTKNKRKNKKNRTYSFEAIENKKDDLWGLSRDCAEEIKNAFR